MRLAPEPAAISHPPFTFARSNGTWLLSTGAHCSLGGAGAGCPALDAAGAADFAAGASCAFYTCGSVAEASSV